MPGAPPVLSPSEYNARYRLHVHRLPPHPKAWDYVAFIPLALYKFVDRLCDAFGYKVRVDGWMDGWMGTRMIWFLNQNKGVSIIVPLTDQCHCNPPTLDCHACSSSACSSPSTASRKGSGSRTCPCPPTTT